MENSISNQKKFVVKSNALIEARYRLSLQESQVILWLLTQIKPEDEDFKSHELKISDFAALTNVNLKNKYMELRKITKRLMQRVIELNETGTNDFIQAAWLSSAHYKSQKGSVLLEFSPKLKPYLLQLKGHFTKIDIVDTLNLKSTYAIRVFELLLQYLHLGFRKISIDDLRLYCGIEEKEYKNYFDLKRKVIEKAKIEINEKNEYEIDYTPIKESRKIVALEWSIKKKNIFQEEQLQQLSVIQKELRSEAAIIECFMEYGFSKAMAKRLLKDHGKDVIKNALKAVDIQVSKGQAKNPKAMLQTAIQEKWHPNIFKKNKKTI
jgi:plasmid replication initiation protein